MSKFEFMDFTGSSDGTEFVVNAKKFTKEQAIELIIAENDWLFDGEHKKYRKPSICDIQDAYVKWYIHTPDFCEPKEGGCYTYCGQNDKGGFPVRIIKYKDLED